MMDSLPLVIFTGQVASTVIGTDAFQEADVIGITAPITKHNYQVRDFRICQELLKKRSILRQQDDLVQFLLISQKIWRMKHFTRL